MPIDLGEMFQSGVAVVTVECQRGVIGPKGPLPALVEAVRESGMVEKSARVLEAAREQGAPVLHGTVVRRPDGGGVKVNCRLFAVTAKSPTSLLEGTESARVVEAFGPGELDYEIPRRHGVSLFHDTELDSILRSLGVETIVLLGVSLNIAIIGTTIEAINRGYQVVIPEDGVVATPADYGKAMLDNSLRMLATITTCGSVEQALRSRGPRGSTNP